MKCRVDMRITAQNAIETKGVQGYSEKIMSTDSKF